MNPKISQNAIDIVYNCITATEPKTVEEISRETGYSHQTLRNAIKTLKSQKEIMICGYIQTSGLPTPCYILGCGDDSNELLQKKKREFVPFREPLHVYLYGEYRKIDQSQCAEM